MVLKLLNRHRVGHRNNPNPRLCINSAVTQSLLQIVKLFRSCFEIVLIDSLHRPIIIQNFSILSFEILNFFLRILDHMPLCVHLFDGFLLFWLAFIALVDVIMLFQKLLSL